MVPRPPLARGRPDSPLLLLCWAPQLSPTCANFQGTAFAETRLLMTSVNPSSAAFSGVSCGPLSCAITKRHAPRLPHAPNFGRQVGPRA
ncbi:hypothetical protein P7K49_038211, partial [Saguinus oedipus]